MHCWSSIWNGINTVACNFKQLKYLIIKSLPNQRLINGIIDLRTSQKMTNPFIKKTVRGTSHSARIHPRNQLKEHNSKSIHIFHSKCCIPKLTIQRGSVSWIYDYRLPKIRQAIYMVPIRPNPILLAWLKFAVALLMPTKLNLLTIFPNIQICGRWRNETRLYIYI